MNWIVKMIQGALIGAGAVLPGVSGGVLAVLFGLYKPLMRFLAHPIKNLKSSLQELWPILLGYVIGYVGIAKVLGADKKKREQEEKAQKESELEELRRKLAELEREKTEQTTSQPTAVESNDNEEIKEDKTE